MKEFLLAFVVLVVSASVLGLALDRERNHWEEFKVANACRITEKRTAPISLGTGVGSSGSVVTIVSGGESQAAWLCADGVTYWR